MTPVPFPSTPWSLVEDLVAADHSTDHPSAAALRFEQVYFAAIRTWVKQRPWDPKPSDTFADAVAERVCRNIVKMMRRYRRRDGVRFRAYLLRCVKGAVSSVGRRLEHRVFVSLEGHDPIDDRPAPIGDDAIGELATTLELTECRIQTIAMRNVEARCAGEAWAIFSLFKGERVPAAEVAVRFGKSEGNVRQIGRRVLKAVIAEFDRLDASHEELERELLSVR